MEVAKTPAAELHQAMTHAVDWAAISPQEEVPVLEEIIHQLGKFPSNMPIFVYPYAVENRFTTVADRIDMLSKRLYLKRHAARKENHGKH